MVAVAQSGNLGRPQSALLSLRRPKFERPQSPRLYRSKLRSVRTHQCAVVRPPGRHIAHIERGRPAYLTNLGPVTVQLTRSCRHCLGGLHNINLHIRQAPVETFQAGIELAMRTDGNCQRVGMPTLPVGHQIFFSSLDLQNEDHRLVSTINQSPKWVKSYFG